MNVGSLFSGIGGLELGFEREGFKTAFFVENNKFCQKILKKNFPKTKIYGDITKINWKKIRSPDILTGGFPCQDISQAGKGAGIIKGTRSSLWKNYAEAIRILRPKFAIIENVPMLPRRGLNVVLADLAEMGYDAEWFCISAQEIGAIHVRERIFIIAYIGQFRRMDSRFQIKPKQAFIENAPSFVTNDWRERIQRFRKETMEGGGSLSRFKDVRRIEEFRERPDIPEPLFRGGRDGIPFWMDRIKACGNAVVPQVAQFIARRIKEVMER